MEANLAQDSSNPRVPAKVETVLDHIGRAGRKMDFGFLLDELSDSTASVYIVPDFLCFEIAAFPMELRVGEHCRGERVSEKPPVRANRRCSQTDRRSQRLAVFRF